MGLPSTCLPLLALSLIAGGALQSKAPAYAESKTEECVSAAITDVHLSTSVDVNEIRVQLSPGSPMTALQVTVESTESDRVIDIDGEPYKALQFTPAMSGNEYRISLFPGTADEDPACLHSVELVSNGESVAFFRP
jgi:hypothetical protein